MLFLGFVSLFLPSFFFFFKNRSVSKTNICTFCVLTANLSGFFKKKSDSFQHIIIFRFCRLIPIISRKTAVEPKCNTAGTGLTGPFRLYKNARTIFLSIAYLVISESGTSLPNLNRCPLNSLEVSSRSPAPHVLLHC